MTPTGSNMSPREFFEALGFVVVDSGRALATPGFNASSKPYMLVTHTDGSSGIPESWDDVSIGAFASDGETIWWAE